MQEAIDSYLPGFGVYIEESLIPVVRSLVNPGPVFLYPK